MLFETLGYTAVSLYWLEGERFVLREQVGPKPPETGQEVLARAVREARPVLPELGVSTWQIAVPLYGHEAVVGVLRVESHTGSEAAETDPKLLGALGEQASIALERALLYAYVQRSEERFRLLTENMSDLICLHGLEGKLRYVSPSSRAVLGLTPEVLLDGPLSPRIHPDDLPGVLEHFANSFAGLDGPLLFRLRRHDGAYRWLEAVTHPLYDAAGRTQGFTSSSWT